MTTKQQERDALAKIRKIVEALGEDSYLGTAFKGVFDTAAQQVLIRILELSEDTAPVEISFGYTRDNHCHKGLIIKSAPPKVVREIVNDSRVMLASLTPNGLYLECRDSEEKE